MLAGKEYKPGVYDISNEEYHSSSGISRGMISEFKKSPKHFWDAYLSENPKNKTTPSLVLGEALHTLLLEPEKFESKFCVAPKINKSTKKGKQEWLEFLAIVNGRTILTEKQCDTAVIYVNEIMCDSDAKELIKGGLYEKSLYWNDDETGLLCKCRPDIWHENFIVDIKTSISADPNNFRYSIDDYDYNIQAAMMLDAVNVTKEQNHKNFIFIVIEKERPYCVGIHQLNPDEIIVAQHEYKAHLERLKWCLEKNSWPGYPKKVISLTDYARNKRIELCQQI